MSNPRITTAYISEANEPGIAKGRVVTIDPTIIIDDYDPKQPEVLWYCDHCQNGFAVTAQFTRGTEYITLCATCLQHALNGIALSLSKPVSFSDGAA